MKSSFGFRRSLILLLLLTLILAPRPLAGLLDMLSADRLDAAHDFAAAASVYASAAERLPWLPSLWERAGRAAFFSGDPDSAVLYLERANERGALSAWGWTYLGGAYLELGEAGLADAALRHALPLAEALQKFAEAARSRGDFSGAVDAWRRSIDYGLNEALNHYQLGLLLAATRPEEALPDLMQAARLDPALAAPVQSLRTAINTALGSDDPAYRFLFVGRALAALGEWDLAEEAFRNAIDANLRYAEAWAWLAEARQQRSLDGGPQLHRALTLNPDLAVVQGLYGLYLQRQGQLEEARIAFLKAAAREPGEASWQLALGSLSEQSGDLVAALGYLNRAVALAPASAPAWQALASFSLRNSTDLSGSGLQAARRLVELAPDDWRSLDLAGQILMETGDTAGAEALLKKALELATEQAGPALHLALLYLQAGDRAAAHSYLSLARTFDPQGPIGERAERLLQQYFP